MRVGDGEVKVAGDGGLGEGGEALAVEAEEVEFLGTCVLLLVDALVVGIVAVVVAACGGEAVGARGDKAADRGFRRGGVLARYVPERVAEAAGAEAVGVGLRLKTLREVGALRPLLRIAKGSGQADRFAPGLPHSYSPTASPSLSGSQLPLASMLFCS
jgi:hypothetical protein